MQNELSLRMCKWSSAFPFLRVTVMAASSTLFIVCRFACELMSICVMVFVLGLNTPAPRMGLPLTCEPSV